MPPVNLLPMSPLTILPTLMLQSFDVSEVLIIGDELKSHAG